MQQLFRLYFYVTICFIFTLTGCGQNHTSNSSKMPGNTLKDSAISELKKTVPGNFSSQSELIFDSTYLSQFFQNYPAFNTYRASVQKFYRSRNFTYAWFDNEGLIEQAGNITNKFLNLEQEGIPQQLPYHQEFDSLLAETNQEASVNPDPKTELMLTAGYFAFARTAWEGLNDSVTQSFNWYVPRKKISYSLLLDSLLQQPERVAQEPVYRQYELLRTFLRKYQQLEKKRDWSPIKATRKVYRPGDKAAEITRIKLRLKDLGDFTGDTNSTKFDADLKTAVKQFQQRQGLPPDGTIGSRTLAELNVPLKNRIRQIIVNMERSRWLPVHLSPDYLAVNIPEYKLHVYKNDSLAWSCRVVVGKAVHKTVIFSGNVKYVVFSPYWYVPASIVRKEVVPGMRRSSRYLARHNMQIIGRRNGLPVVRQRPGPRNSLGQVKFLFPNSYSIYLHDTPSKSLFKENSRAFSHGCIRVSEPAKLAAYLLNDYPEWTEEKIRAAMRLGKEQSVTLQKEIPVYIVYFTAFIDHFGKINFREDIYNRDERLAKMLLENASL